MACNKVRVWDLKEGIAGDIYTYVLCAQDVLLPGFRVPLREEHSRLPARHGPAVKGMDKVVSGAVHRTGPTRDADHQLKNNPFIQTHTYK